MPKQPVQHLMSRGAFTLIEVLISTSLCLVIASAAASCYFKVVSLVRRTEARVAMHADAQSVYGSLHRVFCATEQHCAMVFQSTQSDGSGSATDPGSWRVIFMHGKENNEDWQWANQSQNDNADLVWETWTWRAGSQSLLSATSTPRRTCYLSSSFAPSGGVDFNNTTFSYLPQPRRYLSPTLPEVTLDDNILFPGPATTYPIPSLANTQDYGDMQDLDNNLATVLSHVVASSLQMVAMDGSVLTLDDHSTATTVLQGVWMDGRLAAQLGQPQTFAGSDLALRPRLIRLCYSVNDPHSGLTQTFSFSFPMPGMSGPP